MTEKKVRPDDRTFTILVSLFGGNKDFKKAEYYLSEALSLVCYLRSLSKIKRMK